MKNKKIVIAVLACVLVLGVFVYSQLGNETNELNIALLEVATVDGDNSETSNESVLEIEEEETPLATIGKSNSSSTRNLNSTELDKIRTYLFNSTNSERKSKANNKLVVEYDKLETTGNVRAKEIVQKWSHTRPNGTAWSTVLSANGIKQSDLKAGENLAKIAITPKSSYSDDYLKELADSIHKSLMNSETHKNVILNQNYDELGIGIYSQVEDGKVIIYITEHFKNEATSTVDVSKISISSIANQTYTGKQIKPSITLKYGSKALKNGTDYTLTYGTNKNVGTGTIKITGKGNYTGSKSVSFKIVKSVSKLTISAIKNQTYTGKQIKPSVTVKDGSTTLKNGTNYSVTYGTNKSTGAATVKITGKGNYSGSVTKTFYIVPKAPTSLKLTAASKAMKVSYGKSTGASGYEIAYSTSKTSGFKTVSLTAASKSITKLTSKKTYYVKVRAYKTVGKTKYYSAYTAVKSVKVK